MALPPLHIATPLIIPSTTSSSPSRHLLGPDLIPFFSSINSLNKGPQHQANVKDFVGVVFGSWD